MSDIFISYASEDRSRVEPLAKALEEHGWSVWWDRYIPPGKTFDQVIGEAINAARCVIVLWSKISIKSDWVKEEANIGRQRKILVPVRIDLVDPPLGFGLIQAADLTNWEAEKSHPGFLNLLNAISEVAGLPGERDESTQVSKLAESNLEQHIEELPEKSETSQPDPDHLKPEEKESPITGPKAPRKKRLAFAIGGVALILVLSVLGWFIFSTPDLYTIKALSDRNGSISPTGSVAVGHGDSKTFKIEPNSGYRIADVKVDGSRMGAVSSYTFKNVTDNHTISAGFAKIGFTIKALSDRNGSISPTGSVAVGHGDSKTFKIEPNSGYRIADVKVDGSRMGAVSSYTFKNVTNNHTISAGFAAVTRSIPNPMLKFNGIKSYEVRGKKYKRYSLIVTNWNSFPGELFKPAPDLPPCGKNTNSSRTWVDIYSADANRRLYGFCAISSSQNLKSLSFSVEKGKTPPSSVYIIIKDRRLGTTYRSNIVRIDADQSEILSPSSLKVRIVN